MTDTYTDFIAAKARTAEACGFEADERLFPRQLKGFTGWQFGFALVSPAVVAHMVVGLIGLRSRPLLPPGIAPARLGDRRASRMYACADRSDKSQMVAQPTAPVAVSDEAGSSLTASQVWVRCPVSRSTGAPRPPIFARAPPRRRAQSRAACFRHRPVPVPKPASSSRYRPATPPPRGADPAAEVHQPTGTLDQRRQHVGG